MCPLEPRDRTIPSSLELSRRRSSLWPVFPLGQTLGGEETSGLRLNKFSIFPYPELPARTLFFRTGAPHICSGPTRSPMSQLGSTGIMISRTRPYSPPFPPILTARGHTTDASRRKPSLHRTDQDLSVRVRSQKGQLSSMWPTSMAQIPQGLLVPLEVIVDLELLIIRLQGPQLSKERQIFSWVLPTVSVLMLFHDKSQASYLLRVLSDHQHERKVVHPQREVE